MDKETTGLGRYASFWERFGALMIDAFILWIMVSLLGNLLSQDTDSTFFGVHFSVKGLLLQLVATWLYYALQESSVYQGTAGKRAFGIRVTDLQGKRISFLKATGRHFARILSALLLFFGFMMMLLNARKQTLHDKIAGTVVIHND